MGKPLKPGMKRKRTLARLKRKKIALKKMMMELKKK